MMLPGITVLPERFGTIRYVLAPMAGITDGVFRELMREMGAQAVVSELVSAEGLVRGGGRSRQLMRFSERERPFGIQIFGSNERSLSQAARIAEEEGADFVDINLGCPVRKVVTDGAGAAWLKDLSRLGQMLETVRAVIRVPLTIKIRTGWDSIRNAAEVTQLAAQAGVAWVAIHGRTRAQGYDGSVDWEYIRCVAQHSPIPVIGNGDILIAEQAKEKIEGGFCHAVMIGRGALKNPWIFGELTRSTPPKRDLRAFILRHFDVAVARNGKERSFLSLKKFLSWYSTGLANCSQFRRTIFQTHDIDELRRIAMEYFGVIGETSDTMMIEPFFQGGHG